MEQTNVVQLWQSLSKRERSSLRNFLQSPFFNQRQDVIRLYQWLFKTPDHRMDKHSKESVFRFVFGEQPWDNLQFNYTCSFLSKQIESFIAWEEFNNPGNWRELFLCRALRRRGVRDQFEKKAALLSAQHAEQTQRNAAFYLFRYQLEYEKYAYKVQHDREAPVHIEAITDSLQHFFMLEHLRWAGTALSIQARYGKQNPLPLTEAVLEQARHSVEKGHEEVTMMHLGYAVLSDKENEENFRQLKLLISEKGHLFDHSEVHDLYLLAINFCLRRHNRGERPSYTLEGYKLYREALAKGLLLENNRIQKFAYNNIVRLACLSGERAWAREFLEEYKSALPIEDQENTYAYNLAIFHYLSGEYQKVPDLLQTFDFSDRDTQLNARQMLIRSYYELEEWHSLASLLDSFYIYIRRKKDIGYLRELYLNFIKYVRRLMKISTMSRKKIQALAERIRTEPYLPEREWLLSKVKG